MLNLNLFKIKEKILLIMKMLKIVVIFGFICLLNTYYEYINNEIVQYVFNYCIKIKSRKNKRKQTKNSHLFSVNENTRKLKYLI